MGTGRSPAAFVGLFAATSYVLDLVGRWPGISIPRTDGLEGAAMARSSPLPTGRPVRSDSRMDDGPSRIIISAHQAKMGVTCPNAMGCLDKGLSESARYLMDRLIRLEAA
jgi:hypothetical protein